MIKTEIKEDAELPYRIEIDGLKGASKTPSGAAIVALSVGGMIPKGIRDRKDIARYIFWNYEENTVWRKLIEILENDIF